MKRVIEHIYKRTTEYSHPTQATTTANALDLLSSGIYTEEERFIFELLQNAVDSFDSNNDGELYIKIVITDDHLIFMHNGTPFSERDLEGLCDIGNGNKTSDVRKIGYKGIGFKSVFMHSHLVTVLTNGTCFKFDREACENIVQEKGPEYTGVKMPWQIIPMLTDIPSDIDVKGFNVVTYIKTCNRDSLRRKVEKLLADTRFLLFLKVDNLKISFYDGEEKILMLSKSHENDVLTLLKNDIPQNRWLTYSKEVELPPEIKKNLIHDIKVPTKLKDSEFVEISFAIALDGDGCIVPLKDAVMYTYLPTSYSIGLSFVINANFITDAGRQQIAKDCIWNEFIFSQIPGLYLNWIAEYVAPHHSDWYKVLPHFLELDDELSIAYSQALRDAIDIVPFVRTIDGNTVLIKNAISDFIEINSHIPRDVLNSFVHTEISEDASIESLVSIEIGQALEQYDVACIKAKHVDTLLEKSNIYLADLSDEDLLNFLIWLKRFSGNQNRRFLESLSYAKILLDENNNLVEPIASFFPSEYSDKNPDITENAKIVKQGLAKLFDKDLSNWLKSIGVQEMSNISVIKSVICKKGFIKQDNAIKVIRFIFDSEQKEHVLDTLSSSETGTLKLLTKGGKLESADNLFLDSTYGIHVNAGNSLLDDLFVSPEYVRTNTEVEKWQYFFKKIGVNTQIEIKCRRFDEDTPLYRSLSTYVEFCKKNEKKYNQYPIHTTGLFVDIFIQAQLPPILNFVSDSIHFCRFVWSNVMSAPIHLDESKDYIAGHTGFENYAYGYFKDNVDGHRYLGELLLPYILSSKDILPGTDGRLHKSMDLLAPTDDNFQLCGHYLPTLDLDCKIHIDWLEIINFKTQLNLTDYLTILSAISQEQNITKENKDRINLIYERMSDNWDFSRDSSNYIQLQNWGKTHKLLSKEGVFEYPSSLYLLLSHLSGIELNNQVYHSKYLENSRFALMIEALGVNIIADHRVNGLEDAIIDHDITKMLLLKSDFLTAVTENDAFTEETWRESKEKMESAISSLIFYKVDSISICYGNQEFEKTVYSKDTEYYYVGKFGLANQELLHGAIMKAIDFPLKSRTIFLTILQMDDFIELKDYVKQKGYDTSFITIPQEIIKTPSANSATIGTRLYGNEIATIEQIAENEEAKQLVLEKLKNEGFEVYNADSNYSVVNGVRKGNIEYPLVVKSCKNLEHRIKINPSEWQQLFRPNSMLWLHFGDGIVAPIKAYELFTYQDKITLSFDSINLTQDYRIHKIMEVLHYFNKVHLDLVSLNPNKQRANDMEQYLFDDNNIGNSNLESSEI